MLCLHMVLLCCFLIPFYRLRFIFIYTQAVAIAVAKHILCFRKSLLCGFLVPHRSLFRVFFYAFSVPVEIAKIILCRRKSLLCGSRRPFSGLHRVFRYATANRITNAQIVLRFHIALFCRLAVAFKRLLQIFCDTCAITIASAQLVLRLRIALHCRLAVQFCGFCLVLADAVAGLIAHTQLILCFRAFLLCCFGVPLHSRYIVREFRIQPPGHILGRHISLSRRRFVPLAGLFVVFFNAQSLIIEASAQNALRLGIALLCGLFVPHDRIFFAFFHTRAVLIAPCHLKLCLRASVISGRDHVLLERHFHIACLLIILGIMQVVLLGFLLRFLLRFLTQAKVLHEAHEFSLFIFRANKQEAVHSIFLIAETHSLDFSPQTIPIHTASRRLKPFFNRFCLDGIRDFHLLPTHTDRLQFIRKTYFHLNFAHDDSLPMYL